MPRRKAARRIDGVHRGAAEIPYLLERVTGADRLLVFFPKMQLGPAKPSLGLARFLRHLPSHRLALGADEHTFLGPAGTWAGLRTAVELLQAQARELEVAHDRVVCLGTSFGGAFATYSALLGGAGRAICAGVPFRGGTALQQLVVQAADPRRRLSARKQVAAGLLDTVRRPPPDDPVASLDRLAFRMADEAPAPCELDVLTSERDFTHPSVVEFAEYATGTPKVTVRVHVSDYEQHGGGPLVYKAFEELLERRALPSP